MGFFRRGESFLKKLLPINWSISGSFSRKEDAVSLIVIKMV